MLLKSCGVVGGCDDGVLGVPLLLCCLEAAGPFDLGVTMVTGASFVVSSLSHI